MEKSQNPKILLFSIDFEDIRYLVPDGFKYEERLPQMIGKYLDFLRRHDAKGTFFMVGKAAKHYESLVKEIIAEGHEIGCHTYDHKPLNFHTIESFREDLGKNLDILYALGAKDIHGFRAPGLSLTAKTSWAYEVLEEHGLKYSSSVMATKSAFHGWPEFGTDFKLVDNKIWELPPTLLRNPFLSIPFASSVYFRFLPVMFSKWAMNNAFKRGDPVISYFHSFDIDFEQERFMHPGVDGSQLYNFLMYYNRKGMLERFEKMLPKDITIMPHGKYVEQYLAKTSPGKEQSIATARFATR